MYGHCMAAKQGQLSIYRHWLFMIKVANDMQARWLPAYRDWLLINDSYLYVLALAVYVQAYTGCLNIDAAI